MRSRGANNHEKKTSTTACVKTCAFHMLKKSAKKRAEFAQEEKIMKKSIKALACAIVISGAFLVGNHAGRQDVLDNQTVMSANREVGQYQVEYNGETYDYWYENPTLSALCAEMDGNVTVRKENGMLCYQGDASVVAEDGLDNTVLSVEGNVITVE